MISARALGSVSGRFLPRFLHSLLCSPWCCGGGGAVAVECTSCAAMSVIATNRSAPGRLLAVSRMTWSWVKMASKALLTLAGYGFCAARRPRMRKAVLHERDLVPPCSVGCRCRAGRGGWVASSKVPLVSDLVVPRGWRCGARRCCVRAPLPLALAEGSAIPKSRWDVVGWLLWLVRIWLVARLLRWCVPVVVFVWVVLGLCLLCCGCVSLLCPPRVGSCLWVLGLPYGRPWRRLRGCLYEGGGCHDCVLYCPGVGCTCDDKLVAYHEAECARFLVGSPRRLLYGGYPLSGCERLKQHPGFPTERWCQVHGEAELCGIKGRCV